jgi:hypothetical protein
VRHLDQFALFAGGMVLAGLLMATIRTVEDKPLRWWDYATAIALAMIIIYAAAHTPMPLN